MAGLSRRPTQVCGNMRVVAGPPLRCHGRGPFLSVGAIGTIILARCFRPARAFGFPAKGARRLLLGSGWPRTSYGASFYLDRRNLGLTPRVSDSNPAPSPQDAPTGSDVAIASAMPPMRGGFALRFLSLSGPHSPVFLSLHSDCNAVEP